ncbi:MAG: hypothetical protein JWN64_60 [Parcubacteria group bacterium]|nr:hypothetical protein [Parcubacteria group bacterium]
MTHSNDALKELLAQAVIRNGLVWFEPVENSKIENGCLVLGLRTATGKTQRLMGKGEPRLNLKEAGIPFGKRPSVTLLRKVRRYLAKRSARLSVDKPISQDFLFRVWSGMDLIEALIPSAYVGILELQASLPFAYRRITEKDLDRVSAKVDESVQTVLDKCTVSIHLEAVVPIPGIDLGSPFLIGRKPLLNLVTPADSPEGKALAVYELFYQALAEECRKDNLHITLKKFWCPAFLAKWIVGTRNDFGNPDELAIDFVHTCRAVLKAA